MSDPTFDVNTYDKLNIAESTLQHAIRFADDGYFVFPVHTIGPDGVCSCHKGADCPDPGKQPRLKQFIPKTSPNYVHFAASRDEETIYGWWREYGNTNYGIGFTDRQVALDLEDDAALAHFAKLAKTSPQNLLHSTLSSKTPRGYHVIFETPVPLKGSKVKPVIKSGGKQVAFDIKSKGGFILGPGSRSHRGSYHLISARPATTIPPTILKALLKAGCGAERNLERPVKPIPRGASILDGEGPIPTADHREVLSITSAMINRFPIEPGTRNDQMVRLVGYLIGTGRSPAFTKDVGKLWLYFFNLHGRFQLPLAQAYQALDDEIERTLKNEDFWVQTEDQHIQKINKTFDRLVEEGLDLSDLLVAVGATGGKPFRVSSKGSLSLITAIAKVVLHKLLCTDETAIHLTNNQMMKMTGLKKKRLWELRACFITETDDKGVVVRPAAVAELLTVAVSDKGRRDQSTKGKGVPSAYGIGAQLGPVLEAWADKALEAQERACEEEPSSEPVERQECEDGQAEAQEEPAVMPWDVVAAVAVARSPVVPVKRETRIPAWSPEPVFKATGDAKRDALSLSILFPEQPACRRRVK